MWEPYKKHIQKKDTHGFLKGIVHPSTNNYNLQVVSNLYDILSFVKHKKDISQKVKLGPDNNRPYWLSFYGEKKKKKNLLSSDEEISHSVLEQHEGE